MNLLPGMTDPKPIKSTGLTNLASLRADTGAGRAPKRRVRLGPQKGRPTGRAGDDQSGLVSSTQGLRKKSAV